MQTTDDTPQLTQGSRGNRRTPYKSTRNTPNRTRGNRPNLRNNKTKKLNALRPNPGVQIQTIDRRPGRPTFHHMGPLPDKPTTTVQEPESYNRVRKFKR